MHEAQISKLHGELTRLRELLVECRGKERETQSIVADLRMSLADLEHLVRHQRHHHHHRQWISGSRHNEIYFRPDQKRERTALDPCTAVSERRNKNSK